jgi:hypothetical protein
MKFRLMALTLVVLAGTYLPAKAGVVDTLAIGRNQYEDESREHVFYQSGPAGLQIGDVIVGFNRINDRSSPTPGIPLGNTAYFVFSNTVTSLGAGVTGSGGNPNAVGFSPTLASNPHSLQSILAGIVPAADMPAGTFALLIDRPQGSNFPRDQINQAAGAAFGLGIEANLKDIATNGTDQFAAGFKPGDTSYFTALANTPPSTQTAAFLNSLPEGISFGSFFGGLTVLENNTSFTFNTNVLSNDGTFHQIGVTKGALGGGSDNGLYAKYFGSPGPNDAGLENNATFVFDVGRAGVPEPSSIILLGLGASGLMGMAYRRRQKGLLA